MSTQPSPEKIVIIGGGIAGVSTAYFLATSPALHPSTSITIVEGTGIAAAASGKSGGFLALDWHGSATKSLSAMSYYLHKKLADEYGGKEKWGYRAVDTLSITTDATRKSTKPSPLPWVPDNVVGTSSLGDRRTTAQVHPGLLTRFLAEQVLSKPNTSLILGHATALSSSSEESQASASSSKHTLSIRPKDGGDNIQVEADRIVITAGPWTGNLATDLLGPKVGAKLAVDGNLAHSVVYKSQQELSAHCLFTNMTMEDGSAAAPEVYTRPDGTTYICYAWDNEAPLPSTAAEVVPTKIGIAKLHEQAKTLSSVFDPAQGAEIVAEQACYLPIPERGRPIIGKVPGVEGVYVGSGLSCWGITQGPGTGKCLAELILEGKVKSADISKLAP